MDTSLDSTPECEQLKFAPAKSYCTENAFYDLDTSVDVDTKV